MESKIINLIKYFTKLSIYDYLMKYNKISHIEVLKSAYIVYDTFKVLIDNYELNEEEVWNIGEDVLNEINDKYIVEATDEENSELDGLLKNNLTDEEKYNIIYKFQKNLDTFKRELIKFTNIKENNLNKKIDTFNQSKEVPMWGKNFFAKKTQHNKEIQDTDVKEIFGEQFQSVQDRIPKRSSRTERVNVNYNDTQNNLSDTIKVLPVSLSDSDDTHHDSEFEEYIHNLEATMSTHEEMNNSTLPKLETNNIENISSPKSDVAEPIKPVFKFTKNDNLSNKTQTDNNSENLDTPSWLKDVSEITHDNSETHHNSVDETTTSETYNNSVDEMTTSETHNNSVDEMTTSETHHNSVDETKSTEMYYQPVDDDNFEQIDTTKEKPVIYKLTEFVIYNHINDKIINNSTSLGNIHAAIKFAEHQIKQLIIDDNFKYELDFQMKEDLLTSAINYVNKNHITLNQSLLQTPGKLFQTRHILKVFKSFSQNELLIFLEKFNSPLE